MKPELPVTVDVFRRSGVVRKDRVVDRVHDDVLLEKVGRPVSPDLLQLLVGPAHLPLRPFRVKSEK